MIDFEQFKCPLLVDQRPTSGFSNLIKLIVAWPLRSIESKQRYLSTTEKMPFRGIRAHYEQMSKFEKGRIIGLKEPEWANRRISCHLCRSDAAIRRCWQEWMDNGRFQRHDGSG
ncbi:uncharacterized protein TNCV_4352161 [Trichonephila clavipes]|nr:uncharacterized protein TNCV_4352161 [Trichonephila clavipes]